MVRLLWVCAAGALGTGLRFLLATWVDARFASRFALGTLIVNVVGCFLMGALSGAVVASRFAGQDLRLVLATGLLGGFTTYSAFNQELLRWLRVSPGYAGAYLGVTVLACLAAGWIGLVLVERLAA